MRRVLTSLIIFLLVAVLATPLEAQRPDIGKQYPGLIEMKEKPSKWRAQSIFRETFQMGPWDRLRKVDSFTDELGFTHDTYQQYYKGIKVEGATFRLHTKGSQIWYMSGNYRDIYEDINIRATLANNTAFGRALNHVRARRYIWDNGGKKPEGELVICADPSGQTTPKLAFKYDIYGVEPIYHAEVYIDAHSGEFITENEHLHDIDVSASGTSLYNGNVSFTADQNGSTYRLRQTADGNGIQTFNMNNGTSYNAATDFTSNSSNFGSNNQIGVQAHWSAEQTHKYFLQKHNRNSFDGNGAVIRSYVSANLIGMGYPSNNNAFWDGQRMTYGDGDGVNYGPLVSLDIVGHEIVHGVTQYAANLIYQNESGALNESFSDIFGEAIENFATGSNDWQMGTDIGVSGSGAIRSMDNPNAYGDPDTYGGTNWYTGTGDNGGVHINSGVQNKWFYILTQGESGTNDLGNSYSVTGIGIDKAAAIAYRNLSVYLSASSQYSDARSGAIQAAIDLYGAGSAEEIATTNAWYAVGVGGAYGTISYCTSRGNNSTYEWISNVTVGSFSNNSGAAGYTDFTNQTINVDEGQAYSISLTPTFGSQTYNEYWKIWIDYNADGDFSDAGELAFDAGSLSSTTVTGTINIPNGTSGTTTRMRVSMKWNGAQTECEIFNYGEVEDYTIAIGGGAPPSCDTPTGVSASSTGTTTGNVSWTAVSGAADYTVRWRVQGTSTWSTGNVTSTSGNFTGLAEGTTYEVQVRANCSGGSSSYSSSVTFTTDTTAPSCDTPTGVSASSTGETTGTVSWSAVSGAVDYTVRWRIQGTSTWSSGNVTSAGANLTSLTESTTYEVQVSANCTGASSAYSGSAIFTTDSSALACSTPTGLTANSTGTTTASIDWNDVSGATGYTARWREQGTSTWSTGTVTGSAGNLTGLVENTTYEIQVRADCSGSSSTYSGSVTFTTDSSGGGCGSLVNDSNGFEAGTGWGIWNDGGSDARRSANDAAYSNGTYSIRLRDNTSTSVMTTDNINLTAYSSIQVDFSYYPRSMETGEDFWLQVSTNGGSSYTTVASWASGTDFVNNTRYDESVTINGGFASNTRIRFRCDASGNSDYVYVDDVVITGCTNSVNAVAMLEPAKVENSINTQLLDREDIDLGGGLGNDLNMRLFPNPANQMLNIAFLKPANENAELIIMDLNGRTIQRQKLDPFTENQTLQVNVSDLSSGFYFVHLVTDSGKLSQKFIVQQ